MKKQIIKRGFTVIGKAKMAKFFDDLGLFPPYRWNEGTAAIAICPDNATGSRIWKQYVDNTPRDIILLRDDGWNGSFHDARFRASSNWIWAVRVGKRPGGLKRLRRTYREVRKAYEHALNPMADKGRIRIMLIRRKIWRECGD